MRSVDRIAINLEVYGIRTCIRGLRIRENDILEVLPGDAISEDILQDFRIWTQKTSRWRWSTQHGDRTIRSCEWCDEAIPGRRAVSSRAIAHHLFTDPS